MAANIIEVILRARDQLSGVLKKSSKNVGGFSKSILGMGVAAGAMSAAIILPMKKALAETMAFGDEIGKTVQRTGVAAESLSTLGFVAERSGANFGALTNGLRRMAKAASDADEGLLESQRTFDNLGISIHDAGGKLKPMEALMLEAADSLSVMTDDTKKAAVAQELFGRGGMALLPMLNMGSAGIKEMQERARELGIELTGPQAQAWERIQDGVTDAQTAMKGMKMQIANALAPAFEMIVGKITNATAAMSSWMKEHPGWTKLILGIVAAIAGGMGLIAALAGIVMIAPAIAAAWAVMMGPVGWVILGLAAVGVAVYKFRSEIMEGMLKAADAVLSAVESMLEGLGWLLEKLGVNWLDGAIEGIAKARTKLQEMDDDIDVAQEAAKTLADAANNDLAPALDGLGESAGGAGTKILSFGEKVAQAIAKIKEGDAAQVVRDVAQAMVDAEKGISAAAEIRPAGPREPDELAMAGPEEEVKIISDAAIEDMATKTIDIGVMFSSIGATAGEALGQVGDSFAGATVNMLMSGKSLSKGLSEAFGSWAKSAIASIAKVIVKMLALKALKMVFGGGPLGAFFKGGGIVASHQHGGVVDFGIPAPRGGVLIEAHPGEMVLNKSQQGNLFKLIQSGSGGGGGGAATVNHYHVNALDTENIKHALRFGAFGREIRREFGIA
jgi:hypothetical protein